MTCPYQDDGVCHGACKREDSPCTLIDESCVYLMAIAKERDDAWKRAAVAQEAIHDYVFRIDELKKEIEGLSVELERREAKP